MRCTPACASPACRCATTSRSTPMRCCAAIAREQPGAGLARVSRTIRPATCSTRERSSAIIRAAPGIVAVDEAYYAFASRSFLPRVLEFPNLVVVRTVSKIGMAGVRLGYAVAHPAWIAELDKVRPPYNVNSLTQAVLPVLLAARGPARRAGAAILCRERDAGRRRAGRAAPGGRVSDARQFRPRSRARCRRTGSRLCAMRASWSRTCTAMHPLLAGCLRITIGTPAENDACWKRCRPPRPMNAYAPTAARRRAPPRIERKTRETRDRGRARPRRHRTRGTRHRRAVPRPHAGPGRAPRHDRPQRCARKGDLHIDAPPHRRGHRHHARPGVQGGGRRQEGHRPLRPRLRPARRGAVARGHRSLRPARDSSSMCRSRGR